MMNTPPITPELIAKELARLFFQEPVALPIKDRPPSGMISQMHQTIPCEDADMTYSMDEFSECILKPAVTLFMEAIRAADACPIMPPHDRFAEVRLAGTIVGLVSLHGVCFRCLSEYDVLNSRPLIRLDIMHGVTKPAPG